MKCLTILLLLLCMIPSLGQSPKPFVANTEIKVYISHKTSCDTLISVIHESGSTLLRGVEGRDSIIFTIPKVLTKKSGFMELRTIPSEGWHQWIEIIADTTTQRIEAYVGPKHLVVGKDDYTMITTMVLDRYDNPFPEKTQVLNQAYIKNQQIKKTTETTPLSTFSYFYAPDRTGYGAIASKYKNASSKEFRLDFYANDPDNYNITSTRQHDYADGNQIIKFKTSLLQDEFGNKCENGTLVYFHIIDEKGKIGIATAESIDGFARFEIPAPIYPSTWTVTSVIPNYATANNEINIPFKQAFYDLPVKETKNKLVIGPIVSFLGQHAKYGLNVKMKLCSHDRELDFEVPIHEGFATLNYHLKLIPAGKYNVWITFGNISNSCEITVS